MAISKEKLHSTMQALENSLSEVSPEEGEKISELFELGNNPIKLFLKGSKLGVRRKVLLGAVGMIAFFAVLNLLLLALGIYEWLVVESFKATFLILGLITSIAVTAVAAQRTYQRVLSEVTRVIYLQLQGFFRKLCAHAVVFVSQQVEKHAALTSKGIEKALNAKEQLTERYGNKVPGFVTRRAQKWIDKSPLVTYVKEYSQRIEAGDQANLAEELYNRFNDYMLENVLTGKGAYAWFLGLLAVDLGVWIFILF